MSINYLSEIVGGRSTASDTIQALKSDTVELPKGACRAVHINSGNTIMGILIDDTRVSTFTVIAGHRYEYQFKQIYSTTTNVTGEIIY